VEQKKQRWRRAKAPKRQWILQEETEFLETMMAKRQKKTLSDKKISSHYEGFPEHNPSTFCFLAVSDEHTLQVTTLPTPYGSQAFSQPASRQSLTLTEAEEVIADQRRKMSRYMMHTGKGRLLGKLKDTEEDEDIMADVAFKNRKGAGTKARKELLNDMADEGMTVDNDGVLGGTNDAEFGGRRHFGRLAKDESKKDTVESEERGAVGNDGLAMSDDFYKRDVTAEYEDLDYDANEQFEDDDVDMGEADVHVDSNTGFLDDYISEEDEEYDDADGGAEGLATVAGFRALLAKARGEMPHEGEATDDEKGTKKDGSRPESPKSEVPADEASDTLAQVMAAAEKTAQAATKNVTTETSKSTGVVALDEHGQRILTLDAVRKEIWLHRGGIPVKRLMKIFQIRKKSSQERQNKFRELIKELCTMNVDKVEGNVLVLKQHYANMG
jgi:hypothetical protein